jgi:hypothetical protein
MNTEQSIPAEQKTTAQELIAANIKALIEQLEAGNSDALTAYLDAMSRFHRYSFGNVLSIARQRPGATRVCGFHAWRQLGRNVKKGERGIRILAPIITECRKRILLPKNWSCGGWKDLMRRDIPSHRMRRHSDLRKICKTVG